MKSYYIIQASANVVLHDTVMTCLCFVHDFIGYSVHIIRKVWPVAYISSTSEVTVTSQGVPQKHSNAPSQVHTQNPVQAQNGNLVRTGIFVPEPLGQHCTLDKRTHNWGRTNVVGSANTHSHRVDHCCTHPAVHGIRILKSTVRDRYPRRKR